MYVRPGGVPGVDLTQPQRTRAPAHPADLGYGLGDTGHSRHRTRQPSHPTRQVQKRNPEGTCVAAPIQSGGRPLTQGTFVAAPIQIGGRPLTQGRGRRPRMGARIHGWGGRRYLRIRFVLTDSKQFVINPTRTQGRPSCLGRRRVPPLRLQSLPAPMLRAMRTYEL